MGIELKKVPLDFQWEIGKVWCGYVNPHQIHKCKECNGNRESNEFQELLNEWYSSNNGEYKPNPFVKDCIYNTKAWKNNLTDDDVQALLEAYLKVLKNFVNIVKQKKYLFFANHTATKEEWFKMLNDGFVYHKEGNVIFI